MGRYPQSNGAKTPSVVTNRFIGVSRKAIAPEGSFSDCENVASDNYPGICSSSGYEDVSKELYNIQAMIKPPAGDTGFCGVADGKVYWNGAEAEFAPESNFTVQPESKIVLYTFNKYLYIYEMRRSGYAVLYQYDTANRYNREKNYIIVCYQNYVPTAGDGLYLGFKKIDNDLMYSYYYEEYIDGQYVTKFNTKYMYTLFTDTMYKDYENRGFDIPYKMDRSNLAAFPNLAGTGNGNEATLGVELVIFGETKDDDIAGMDKFMYYREDINDVPDRSKAIRCFTYGRGASLKTSVEGGIQRYRDYLPIIFYSDEINYDEYNEPMVRDGIEYKRVHPLWTDGINEGVKVGGLYRRDQMLPQITSPCIYKNRMWAGKIKGDGIVATAFDSGHFFYSFKGLSSDSVEINISSEGTFTGLKEYNDSLLCFKQNRIIVIYGDTAYNFAIGKEIENIGCIDIRSCVTVDGVLYFCGKEGFYSYSGGWPQFISKEFDARFVSCIAFCQDGKYYAEGTRRDGKKELFVYDTRSGIWLMEKSQGITGICAVGNDIYVSTEQDGVKKKRHSVDYTDNNESWFFESGDLYEGIFENKGILEITVRAKIKEDGTMTVATVDEDGNIEEHGTCYGTGKLRTYRVPVKLEKAEAYKYRISGDGPAMIYDIERKVSAGGRTMGE